MNKDIKNKFKEKITQKTQDLRCPLCHNNNMVIEGPFSKTIQSNPGSLVIGGPSVPTMAVICSNCGYIREFALGSVGLLDQIKKRKEKDEKKE